MDSARAEPVVDSDGDGSLLWERRYNDLRRWRARRGNCSVPKAEGKLGRWVVRQRELHKKGKLEADRKAQLDALGFVWNTNEAAWEGRYALLREYAARNGHCCVPISDPALGMWVAKMRANRRRGKLPEHRVRKLDALHFVWNTAEADWRDKFERLLQFGAQEGHACVPFNEGELGWWVNTQRQSKRKGKLSKVREEMLNNAHFVWNPQEFLAARRRLAASTKARRHAATATAGKKRSAAAASLTSQTVEKKSRKLSLESTTSLEPCTAQSGSHMVSPSLDIVSPMPGNESHATSSSGISRITTLWGPPVLDIRGLEPSHVVSATQLTLEQDPQLAQIGDTSSASCAHRGDVQSIASLLSPSPISNCTIAPCTPDSQNLRAQPSWHTETSDLPSFHSDRIQLTTVASGARRAPSPHNFVLPPISSLKMISNPLHI